MMIDPKYTGVPNISFSLTDKSDKREVEYSKQRIERGFDDSETWSFDTTIASFILPRLRRFKEVRGGYPSSITNDEWDNILDKMIIGFDLVIKDCNGIISDEEVKQMNEGMDLFRRWFFDLWW
jgi:hypothetical protein